ncbi:hypothetical protein KBB96_09580 [Luteolibacter ambystomatis]|uniref:Uncharacterized protein n=1 Tax=Luteolibacter ambystomatis TaxID=2824561 RepID=A0A975J314_9BACT|nr:hypothetical protein [Luteolibacter ambystomatis]QUE53130.1 hypothetical protein KBB96_09580 [Luteolibacter ambystomatis]
MQREIKSRNVLAEMLMRRATEGVGMVIVATVLLATAPGSKAGLEELVPIEIAEPAQRVEALSQLPELDALIFGAPSLEDIRLMQFWGNFPNWPNWANFNNWPNWPNWPNIPVR